MSEPRRWRSDDVPDEIRRMLDAGRPTRPMPTEVHKRVVRRLGVAFASSTGLVLLSWKSLALAATLGVAGVTTVMVTKHLVERAAVEQASRSPVVSMRHTSSDAIVRDATVEPARAEVPSIPGADAPEKPYLPAQRVQSSVKRAEPHRAAPRPARVFEQEPTGVHSPEDKLAREIALLGRARAELDRDPRAALATLDEHARFFAEGQLFIERELLALDVLERLGRRAEARERAQRLLGRARGTIYEERIRARVAGP